MPSRKRFNSRNTHMQHQGGAFGSGSASAASAAANVSPATMNQSALLYLEFRATMLQNISDAGVAVHPDTMAVFDVSGGMWRQFKFNPDWQMIHRKIDASVPYGSRNSVQLTYQIKVGVGKGAPPLADIVMPAAGVSAGRRESLVRRADFWPHKVSEDTFHAYQYPFKNWIDGTVGKVFFGDVDYVNQQHGAKQHGAKIKPMLNPTDASPRGVPNLTNPAWSALFQRFRKWCTGLDLAEFDRVSGAINGPTSVYIPYLYNPRRASVVSSSQQKIVILALLYNNQNNSQVNAASLIISRCLNHGGNTNPKCAKGFATSIIDIIRMEQEQDLRQIYGGSPQAPGTVAAVGSWYDKWFEQQKSFKCGLVDKSDNTIHRACSIVTKHGGTWVLRDALDLNRKYGLNQDGKAGSWPPEVAQIAASGRTFSVGKMKVAQTKPDQAAAPAGAAVEQHRLTMRKSKMPTVEDAAARRRLTAAEVRKKKKKKLLQERRSVRRTDSKIMSKQGIWLMVSLPKMPHTLIVIIRMGLVFTIGGGYDPKDVVSTRVPGCVTAPLLIFSPDTAIYGMLETVGLNQFKGTVRSDAFFDQYITNAGFYEKEQQDNLQNLITAATSDESFEWSTKGEVVPSIKNKDDVATFQMPISWEGGAYSSWSGEKTGGMNCKSVAAWIAGLARSWIIERPDAPAIVAKKLGIKVQQMSTTALANSQKFIAEYLNFKDPTGSHQEKSMLMHAANAGVADDYGCVSACQPTTVCGSKSTSGCNECFRCTSPAAQQQQQPPSLGSAGHTLYQTAIGREQQRQQQQQQQQPSTAQYKAGLGQQGHSFVHQPGFRFGRGGRRRKKSRRRRKRRVGKSTRRKRRKRRRRRKRTKRRRYRKHRRTRR